MIEEGTRRVNPKKERRISVRKELNITEGIFPMPVLMVATYNEDGTVNVMNAAWGTMQERDTVALNLTESHKTVKNILKRGAFTVSMGDAEHAAACDYVGIESGNSVPDKVARAGFHVTKSEHVDAPMIDELPLTLECKLVSFDEETELLLGEVVNVSVDERALDENGKLAVEKLHVITFDYANHGYYVLGEKVASAFEDGKKFK